jgi:hypothetical protein
MLPFRAFVKLDPSGFGLIKLEFAVTSGKYRDDRRVARPD